MNIQRYQAVPAKTCEGPNMAPEHEWAIVRGRLPMASTNDKAAADVIVAALNFYGLLCENARKPLTPEERRAAIRHANSSDLETCQTNMLATEAPLLFTEEDFLGHSKTPHSHNVPDPTPPHGYKFCEKKDAEKREQNPAEFYGFAMIEGKWKGPGWISGRGNCRFLRRI